MNPKLEMRTKQITFLLPGYTSTTSAESILSAHACHAAFRFSSDEEHQPWQSQLADVCGIDTARGKRLPFARLQASVCEQASAERTREFSKDVVRADPVSLKADRDTAKLLPAQLLALTEDEADELLFALNEFVAQDGLQFFRTSANQWYMSGMNAEALESYPPSFLADRNASAFLPDGDAAAPWRSLLTEIQMLLHMQPVNELRERRGLLPVNSVWFWGGADLPQPTKPSADVLVFADDAQAKMLSHHVGIDCRKLSAFSVLSLSQSTAEHIVVIDDSLVSAWLQTDAELLEAISTRINDQWLQPLVQLVEQGLLEQVQILTEDGVHGVCDIQSVRSSSSTKEARWWTRIWAGIRR